jgi:hypothetical protein
MVLREGHRGFHNWALEEKSSERSASRASLACRLLLLICYIIGLGLGEALMSGRTQDMVVPGIPSLFSVSTLLFFS